MKECPVCTLVLDDDGYCERCKRFPAGEAWVADFAGYTIDGSMPIEMAGMSFQTGAAVAFGLMGMAAAIAAMNLQGCWTCGRHSLTRVYDMPGDEFLRPGYRCHDCDAAERKRR